MNVFKIQYEQILGGDLMVQKEEFFECVEDAADRMKELSECKWLKDIKSIPQSDCEISANNKGQITLIEVSNGWSTNRFTAYMSAEQVTPKKKRQCVALHFTVFMDVPNVVGETDDEAERNAMEMVKDDIDAIHEIAKKHGGGCLLKVTEFHD